MADHHMLDGQKRFMVIFHLTVIHPNSYELTKCLEHVIIDCVLSDTSTLGRDQTLDIRPEKLGYMGCSSHLSRGKS